MCSDWRLEIRDQEISNIKYRITNDEVDDEVDDVKVMKLKC